MLRPAGQQLLQRLSAAFGVALLHPAGFGRFELGEVALLVELPHALFVAFLSLRRDVAVGDGFRQRDAGTADGQGQQEAQSAAGMNGVCVSHLC